mmetsp:Transcript_22707/g.58121  ORF Transcript_22707/g.58121 Transcript_22707/m.58121 type:complete len:205 (-) Transcript_22707:1756-2370(-)
MCAHGSRADCLLWVRPSSRSPHAAEPEVDGGDLFTVSDKRAISADSRHLQVVGSSAAAVTGVGAAAARKLVADAVAVMATRTPAVRERCRQLVAVLQASRCKHMVVRAEELQGELQLTQLDIVSVRPAPSVGASKVLPSCTQLGICLGFFIGAELCGQWGRQRAARAATQRVSRKLLGFDEQKPPGRVHAPVDRMTIKGARELW